MMMGRMDPIHPLPWSYEVHELSEGYSAIIYDAKGHCVVDHLDEATANQIVKGVNGPPVSPSDPLPASSGTMAVEQRGIRHIQNSMPSDGFDCIYLYEDGKEVGCMNGPQSDLDVQRRAADWVLSALASPTWRDIDSAPKDGTPILGGGYSCGEWYCVTLEITSDNWRDDWEDAPTHWQPLPSAPGARAALKAAGEEA